MCEISAAQMEGRWGEIESVWRILEMFFLLVPEAAVLVGLGELHIAYAILESKGFSVIGPW